MGATHLRIDLNCDLGESYGAYQIGNDPLVLPLITSANVACGFHGGDYRVMHETVRLAKQHGVAVGAHPGYPDLHGFGRRPMQLSADEVFDLVVYQIGALAAIAKVEDVPLQHVKPHGALYNQAAVDAKLADAIASAIASVSVHLILYGLCNSELVRAGLAYGLRVAQEAFIDRHYQANGQLVDRRHADAFVHDPAEATARVLRMLQTGQVETPEGQIVEMRADTLCIHGDGPHAIAFAKSVREALTAHGVDVRAVSAVERGDTHG